MRPARGLSILGALVTLRALLRRPGVGVTCVLILGLAIGGNTAIFSLLDAVALRPLPYRAAGELVQIGAAVQGLADLKEISWPKFQALAAQSRDLAAVAAYYENRFGLTERERTEELAGARVSAGFFRVWGVQPVLGRTFAADEQARGGPDVVLLSYGYWRQRFGGDRGVLGRKLEIEGLPTTIIGVVPDTLRFPFAGVQIWLPRPDEAGFISPKWLDQGAGYLQMVARLRRGVPARAAQAEADGIAADYRARLPGQLDQAHRLVLVPLDEHLVGAARSTLWILLGAVFAVLCIACADAANLLLAAGVMRRREQAVRAALGASRRRLLGEALLESGLIGGAACLLGSGLAFAGLKLLVAAHPADLPRIADAGLSPRALAFDLAVTLLAVVLAGAAPALQTLRSDPAKLLAEGQRGTAGSRWMTRGQGLLVTGEIALALILLSAAGLLLRSLQHVNAIELGFDPRRLLSVQLTLPEAKHPGVAERRVFFEELLARAGSMGGVKAAALAEYPPGVGAPHTRLSVEGQPPVPPERQPLVLRAIVSAGYFRTLGTRFVRGRDFDPRTAPDAPLTAVVNRSLERQLFGGQDPLGARIRVRTGTVAEVIGVVEDTQQDPLEAGKEPMVFFPQRQAGADLSPPNFMTLLVRTDLPAAGFAAALRRAVDTVDPGQPLAEVTPVAEALAAGTARRRLTTGLLSAFSALALALSVLGVYGVLAHAVAQRRRDIGVRMALGASRPRAVRYVLDLGARWIVAGLLLGGLGSFAAGRALASQLFEVSAAGGAHLAVATSTMAAVALLGCVLPAWRAARVDPATALRQE